MKQLNRLNELNQLNEDLPSPAAAGFGAASHVASAIGCEADKCCVEPGALFGYPGQSGRVAPGPTENPSESHQITPDQSAEGRGPRLQASIPLLSATARLGSGKAGAGTSQMHRELSQVKPS